MRSRHAFMHHEISGNSCAFSGSQYRPTDDDFRWSTPLQQRRAPRHAEGQRPFARVAQVETCVN